MVGEWINICFRGLFYQNMGNCFARCFGKIDKRKYLRTRYNVERDISIEFENLMDDENQQDEMSNLLTPRERHLLSGKRYTELVEEQKRLDTSIDVELVRQEEELRQEEEAYYEAKREAARAARAQKQKELNSRANAGVVNNGPNAWLGDENEWEVAGGEDDFEMFLESVKARSLAARTRALESQDSWLTGVPLDAQSTSSSQQRSHTEASSIDLEWEHEAEKGSLLANNKGMQPMLRSQSPPPEELIAELAISKPMLTKTGPDLSGLEWDTDFDTESMEKCSLLRKDGSSTMEEEADR